MAKSLQLYVALVFVSMLAGSMGRSALGKPETPSRSNTSEYPLASNRLTRQEEQQQKPAEEVYKNIQIFKGVPAPRLQRAMSFISGWLGVDCSYCHVPGEFDKDDKQPKQTARKMFQMVRAINKSIDSNKVTCFTCHRGAPKPGPASVSPPGWKPPEPKPGAPDNRAGELVYKNVQVLKGVPVSKWMNYMTFMSASLGVNCTYCHVAGKFESDDKPEKVTARKMIEMTKETGKTNFGNTSTITCYTCHRGKTMPVSMPAQTKEK